MVIAELFSASCIIQIVALPPQIRNKPAKPLFHFHRKTSQLECRFFDDYYNLSSKDKSEVPHRISCFPIGRRMLALGRSYSNCACYHRPCWLQGADMEVLAVLWSWGHCTCELVDFTGEGQHPHHYCSHWGLLAAGSGDFRRWGVV